MIKLVIKINDFTLQTKKQRLENIDRLIFINNLDRQVVSVYFAQLLNACVEESHGVFSIS